MKVDLSSGELPRKGMKCHRRFKVTEEFVKNFAALSGDYNSLHVSTAAARDYGFVKPVCHGAILLGELSRVIGMEIPGIGAMWTEVQVEFKNPFYWNDTVDVYAEVLQASPAVRMIKIQYDVLVGEKPILHGTAKVLKLKKLNRRYIVPEINKRIALVTGGSRGVGLAITRELLGAGYKVITVSRKTNPGLEQLSEKHDNLQTIFADLASDGVLEAELDKQAATEVNIIVHAASPPPVSGTITAGLYGEIEKLNRIYLGSLITLVARYIRKMKRNKYGRIVTLGTSYILGSPPPAMFSYVTAKEALWGLTKSLAIQYAAQGITANMISPGMMLTDMTADIPNAAKAAEAESSPALRLAEVDEVAKTIEFICSEKASFINGVNLPVTGGK